MPAFTGQLRANEVMGSLFNMIISQEVFADNIAGTHSSLVDKARVDAGLYGDQKLYYAADVLKSAPWLGDQEAQNLLALHRPADPKCQAIILDTFRKISLTTDQYLSKRAWGDEYAFGQFNAVMMGTMVDTKRIYDSTIYNAYIGTHESRIGKQIVEVPLSEITATGEEKNRLEAETIAESLANLIVEMSDVSRDFNDYGFLRSYDPRNIIVVWNSKYVNKIKKVDLPTIFNKDGLVDKFEEEVLPARYFGAVNTASGTTASANTKIRSLVEKDFGSKHCFPGDLLPNATAYGANETYTQKDDVICKVLVKLPAYMSSFEVGTNFVNALSLTENHYLIFGRNTIEAFKNYPFITVYAA